MKTEKNIFIAFVLNFLFSIFEFLGGVLTGSIAIISDSVHDLGDATSIGFSYFMEKKSKKKPDKNYTFGYGRFSALGCVVTSFILIVGSIVVIYNSINRIFNPVKINYDGMIVFAVVGVVVNALATFVTHKGSSLNQKAVNLHMLEDVLGWIVVLVGSIVMKFTNFSIIDPILSICVAVFIMINVFINLKEVLDLFLEKVPRGVSVDDIKEKIMNVDGVVRVCEVKVLSIDGENHYAIIRLVAYKDFDLIKHIIRHKLADIGICDVTIEFEKEGEVHYIKNACASFDKKHKHCHHHH